MVDRLFLSLLGLVYIVQILRFLSVHALLSIVLSCFFSALTLIALGYFLGLPVPRSIPIIYTTYLIFLCGGARLCVRVFVSRQDW